MSHHGYSLFHLGWRRWWAQNRPRILTDEDVRREDAARAVNWSHWDHDRFPPWLLLCFSHLIAFGVGVMVGGCQVGR